MTSVFYDAVILGAEIEPLLCAALLAQDGFRVLVIGQKSVESHYTHEGFTLPNRQLGLVAHDSPLARRCIESLGLQQTVAQQFRTPGTSLQLCTPTERWCLHSDATKRRQDLLRVFGAQADNAARIFDKALSASRAIDPWLVHEIVHRDRPQWLKRLRSPTCTPFDTGDASWAPLEHANSSSGLRATLGAAIEALVAQRDEDLTDLAKVRALSQALRDPLQLPFGWFETQLQDRIRAYSGSLRLTDSAASLEFDSLGTAKLTIERSDDEVGFRNLVIGCSEHELSKLMQHGLPSGMLGTDDAQATKATHRLMNFVVHSDALPALLLSHSVWFDPDNESEPPLVLRRSSLSAQHSLLAARVRIAPGANDEIRDRLYRYLPFLERHVVTASSPPDSAAEPANTRDGFLEITATASRLHGLGARSAKTPHRQITFCNSRVHPKLGAEGIFATALESTRLVASSYRRRPWMRRGLFQD